MLFFLLLYKLTYLLFYPICHIKRWSLSWYKTLTRFKIYTNWITLNSFNSKSLTVEDRTCFYNYTSNSWSHQAHVIVIQEHTKLCNSRSPSKIKLSWKRICFTYFSRLPSTVERRPSLVPIEPSRFSLLKVYWRRWSMISTEQSSTQK